MRPRLALFSTDSLGEHYPESLWPFVWDPLNVTGGGWDGDRGDHRDGGRRGDGLGDGGGGDGGGGDGGGGDGGGGDGGANGGSLGGGGEGGGLGGGEGGVGGEGGDGGGGQKCTIEQTTVWFLVQSASCQKPLPIELLPTKCTQCSFPPMLSGVRGKNFWKAASCPSGSKKTPSVSRSVRPYGPGMHGDATGEAARTPWSSVALVMAHQPRTLVLDDHLVVFHVGEKEVVLFPGPRHSKGRSAGSFQTSLCAELGGLRHPRK